MNQTEKNLVISISVGLAFLLITGYYVNKKYGHLLEGANSTNQFIDDVKTGIHSVEDFFAGFFDGQDSGNGYATTPAML